MGDIDDAIKKAKAIDIRQFIIVIPGVDIGELMKIVEARGLTLSQPIKGYDVLYTIDALEVKPEDLFDVTQKILDVKEQIKETQISALEYQKEHVRLESRLTQLFGELIAEHNKKYTVSPDKLFQILESIYRNLYLSSLDKFQFVDEKTIRNLVEATISKTQEEAEENINQAIVNLLIEIRKLTLISYFEHLSMCLFNIRVGRENLAEITGEIDDKTLDVIPITLWRDKKRIKETLYYWGVKNSIYTFDMGRRSQDVLIPLISVTFLDKISLQFRIEYTQKVILQAFNRLLGEVGREIGDMELDFDEISLSELEANRERFKLTFEYIYRMLTLYGNQFGAENDDIKRRYTIGYSRQLSNAFGGSISEKIRPITSLAVINEANKTLTDIHDSRKNVENFKTKMIKTLNELIKSKKEGKKSIFKRALEELKDYSQGVLAKLIKEYLPDN